MSYNFITIEGNIGAGKTTLAKMLSYDMNAGLILEQFADNPFLPDFYIDPVRNAFALELFFMAERYQQLQETIQKDLFQNQLISDYLFSKSLLFAKTNLKQNELDLYLRLFNIINSQLPKPDLVFYLHADVDQLIRNIAKRGREYEKNIKRHYLKKIENAYFEHFKYLKDQCVVMILKTDQIDFVNREIDYLRIKKILNSNVEKGIHVL